MEQVIKITEFVIESFIHIWPYLLVTIPLAVIINLSGMSKYITAAFAGKPLIAVFMATCVGAFSPFCSCGVIPVITSLLTGGVPVAPVMSFWIASPSMDPEIFFLSSSMIGMKLAVWRLSSTFIISLGAGYLTHLATVTGFLGRGESLRIKNTDLSTEVLVTGGGTCACGQPSWQQRILPETLKASALVAKFMGIAFLITALLKFYVPADFISKIVSENGNMQVFIATLAGIPAYTSNITALPLVGGLLQSGLSGGAALSFLIAGATTTLPAMIAVWGIASRKVFLLYILFITVGSVLTGLLYNLAG
ncbi:MAG TPA: permease [Bacteroidales bacterium]|nr:permease [Bacteroidales bacterium]